jgi:hypothetical protein
MSDEPTKRPEPPIEQHFLVNGIVAVRDGQPYIQIIMGEGVMSQWNVTEARSFAWDIIRMCSRTEADAMILKFFNNLDIPKEAAAGFMQEFRDYRHELDRLEVDRGDARPPEEGGGRVE